MLAVLVAGLCVAPQAFAQAPLTMEVQSPQSVAAYWTPERLASARPMPLPGASATAGDKSGPNGPFVGSAGSPGSSNVKASTNDVFAPSAEAAEADEVAPDMFGTSGQPFTSSRMVPNALIVQSMVVYPFRINGKLFFTQPGVGNFVCSATVQRFRIVTTAGHCVHRGSGGGAGFFTNFSFRPGLRDGVSPLGAWPAVFIVVTGTWAGGGGGVPNAADYAVMEMADIGAGNPCGAGTRIGACLGFAGFQTGSFANEHITAVGYPCNIDSCNKMHRVDAEPFLLTNNTLQIGSDARGGSSGGGWYQNFGEYGVGQPGTALNAGLLRLRSVTSYGPISTAPKYQGGSIFDNRYSGVNGFSILNIACAHRAGNC
jgi:V8-like Glu-specific endopeptidase